MTHDQHVLLSHWHHWGAVGFVSRVKSGWIIHGEGVTALIGRVPKVFRRKRDALDFVDNLVLIRAREWKEVAP